MDRVKRGATAFVAAFTSVVLVAAGREVVNGAQAERTVRDQIYSKEQADRGRALFDAQCAACHPGMGPELRGDEFLATWENKTARALYSRIISTMPSDDPGTLSEQQVLDLVAYIVSSNGFPAGPKAIEKADDLNDVKLVKGP